MEPQELLQQNQVRFEDHQRPPPFSRSGVLGSCRENVRREPVDEGAEAPATKPGARGRKARETGLLEDEGEGRGMDQGQLRFR